MKVYVVTSAEPMEAEIYETVKPSFEEAEKYIRAYFPNARKDNPFGNKKYTLNGNITSFICKKNGNILLMFIREETLI